MKRLMLAILLLVLATLTASAELSIVRKGYYVVRTPAGEVVSQHAELDKAIASASRWSEANDGQAATITPPSYEVTDDPQSNDGDHTVPDLGGGVDPPGGDGGDAGPVGDLPANVLKLGEQGETVTLAMVQQALDGDRPVAVPAGITLEGSLVLPDGYEWLGVWGEGDRPVLVVPVGRHGIAATSDKIESVVIQGWEVRGPDELQSEVVGIRLRLNSGADKYAKHFEIDDCKVTQFDTLVEIVDDWSRFQVPGTPGRIKLSVKNCILAHAYGNDSHSAGIYAEGLAEGWTVERTVIWHVGWTTDGKDTREKRSHCLYAQQFGGPAYLQDCYLGEPAANALMLRRGGVVERVVISGAPLAASIFGGHGEEASRFADVAIVDQRDIDPEIATERRGTTFQAWSLPRFAMAGVVVARRHGQTLNQSVVEVSGAATVADVAVVAYPVGASVPVIKLNGGEAAGREGNRVLAEDPGVPAVSAELLGRLLSRQRGEVWADEDTPAAFVARAKEAVK